MRVVSDKSTDAVVDEAAEWMVRLNAMDATLEDKREFVAWLKRSPVHLGEYLKAECTWADLGGVDPERRVNVRELLAREDSNVVELIAPAQAGASRRFSSRVVGALAATVLAMFGAVFWLQRDKSPHYTTAVGEQRTIRLVDGSTVVLNTGTDIRLHFTDGLREVKLLQGEALFNVAKDASRPFRVLSDRAIAQAVGTSFTVYRKPAETVVTVLEGQVAVAHFAQEKEFSLNTIPVQAVRVSAGARADIADQKIQTSRVKNSAAVTAWKNGRLIFEGETLAEVVDTFNRYNKEQLVLSDSSLSGERLSGVFDADQPRALVRFLEHSGVVQPVTESGATLVLVPQR